MEARGCGLENLSEFTREALKEYIKARGIGRQTSTPELSPVKETTKCQSVT
jgi:hypothetical protein